MSPIFYFALLIGVGILATRDVTCFTNKDFVDLALEYGAEIQSAKNDVTQNEDDVIYLPGNLDDELDVDFLIAKLGITFSETGSDIYLRDLGSGCSCSHYTCGCCVEQTFSVWGYSFRFSGCIRVTYLASNFGFRLAITFNGREVYNREISIRNPPQLCYGIPGLSGWASVCLQLYNVDLAQKSLCARLVGTIDLKIKKFTVNLNLGCFRIPILSEAQFAQLAEIADSQKLTFQPYKAEKSQNGAEESVEVNTLSELIRVLRKMDV